MQPGTRKFFTNERSIHKQSKPSYQQVSHTEKDLPHPYYAQHAVRRELIRNNSDADLKIPKQQYFKNLNQRRKNDGQMTNLKSELQNLKSQVNRLINKQSTLRTPQKQRFPIRQQRSDKKINYVTKGFHAEFTDQEEDFSDTASMTSVTTQKVLNQPLRRLQKNASSQNYDQSYYMQLENDLLKTQIKNLKNKYVSKKRQLTEKCDLLEKKNQYLEISLQKSQESLAECRKNLEVEIMAIKRQISLKTEIKSQVHLPETDRPSDSSEGNEMLQQKLKKLYEQMADKNKLVNNISIELSDLETELDRKKFDLKKEVEKNLELSKQIELTKRENSRLQLLVESQMSKKKDILKQNAQLKQRNKGLMQEVYRKEQIVTGSEQYENRMAEEIQLYKKKEDELQTKLSSIREQNRKLKQLLSTNNDQISSLKRSYDDSTSRIAQLSRKLKDEQQKTLQREDYYQRVAEQSRRIDEEKTRSLKEYYDQQYTLKSSQQQALSQQSMLKEQSMEAHDLLRQKERQVNRWKAEYKILKLKHEEKHNSESLKKEELQQYYKGFSQFKAKAELLQDRNSLLQETVQNLLKKLNQKESQAIKVELTHNRAVQKLNQQIKTLKNQVQNLNDQLSLAKAHLVQTLSRNEQQTKYRQQLETKIQHFIQKRLSPESSDEQANSNEDHQEDDVEMQQSQEKNQKYFLEDEEQEEQKNPKTNQKVKRKQQKSKTEKIIIEPLTQSDKIQLEQLSESITTIKKRVIQLDQKLAKNIRQLKNKDNQINKLKKQIRELLEAHENQLFQIKDKYTGEKAEHLIKSTIETEKDVRELCEKEIQLHKKKYAEILDQNVEMKTIITQIEKQLLDLRQQTKSLSHLYNVKCSQVQQILQKNYYELSQKQKKLEDLQALKQQRETALLKDISNLKDQISSLRLDIRQLTSINQKIEVSSFDQALRNQIESSKTLREELAKKNQEVFKVRDNYTLLRSQYDNLRSQNEVQKLKHLSQRKNLDVQYQIELQNLKNKLNVEERKASSLEQKISLVIEQNKKKDSFIQTYIMGKKLPQGDKEFVAQFIKQYEIQLNGKSINQKLRGDSEELQKMASYNYSLLKDMADMKERMLLYETMQGEVLSVYDSIQSGEHGQQNDIESPSTSVNQSPDSPSIKFKKMSSLVDTQQNA